jgi:hypothetical protein
MYAKIFAAVVAGSLVYRSSFCFQEGPSRNRKLELETTLLQSEGAVAGEIEGGTSIKIAHSGKVRVHGLTDPRLLGPLLLLLDFIFASIVLVLAGYCPWREGLGRSIPFSFPYIQG